MTLKPAPLAVCFFLAALAQGCTKSPSDTDTANANGGAVAGSTTTSKAAMPTGPSAQLTVPHSGS